MDDLGADPLVHIECSRNIGRNTLMRQEARAFEPELPRMHRRRKRMVRTGGAEGRDALRALINCALQQVLEFAHLVAAVQAAGCFVMLDGDVK